MPPIGTPRPSASERRSSATAFESDTRTVLPMLSSSAGSVDASIEPPPVERSSAAPPDKPVRSAMVLSITDVAAAVSSRKSDGGPSFTVVSTSTRLLTIDAGTLESVERVQAAELMTRHAVHHNKLLLEIGSRVCILENDGAEDRVVPRRFSWTNDFLMLRDLRHAAHL